MAPSRSMRITRRAAESQTNNRPWRSKSRPLLPIFSLKATDLPSRVSLQMWPLPLERTPSSGCHAGPSPPAPPSASTLRVAPGSKIGSSAASAHATTASTRAKHAAWQRIARRLRWLFPLVHQLAAKIRPQGLRVADRLDRAGKQVTVEHDEVGELAFFQRTDLVLEEEQFRVVDGVKANCLLARQRFLGVQRALEPAGLTRDRGLHAEERVVRVDRAKRADLLHVVGPAADGDARGEQALERLKPAETFLSELPAERAGVEVEPGGLDVDDHAEAGALVDRLLAHEVRVRQAGPRLPQRHLFVEILVDVEERVDRPVADGVGGELQTALGRRADHPRQPVFRDEQEAAVLRVGNAVDAADAPRLAHVGAAGEHAAVEEG